MKDYVPTTDKPVEVLEAELQVLKDISDKMTEWPDVDNYYYGPVSKTPQYLRLLQLKKWYRMEAIINGVETE